MSREILTAIIRHLVPLLEEELVKLEPRFQDFLLTEAKLLAANIDEWVKGKLKAHEGT